MKTREKTSKKMIERPRQVVFSVAAFLFAASNSCLGQGLNPSPPPDKAPVIVPVPMAMPVPMTMPVPAGRAAVPYSASTDSTTLQTGTQSTTLSVGTQSTLLQSGTDSSLLRTGVERQAGPINILFILDGSRSMLDKLDSKTRKIHAAKQVLQNAIQRIPTDVNLGLRVFGHGYQGENTSMFGGGFGSLNLDLECRNSVLLVPVGRGTEKSIIEKIRQIRPYGMTPLAYSIEQAAINDFRGLNGTKTIILITDGADTCNGNPCEVIKQLPLYGIKLKVDVVGLDLRREPLARHQLNCIAQESGGKYYDANNAADLIDSVSQSVSKAIEGRVIIRPSTGTGGSGANPVNIMTPPELVPIEPMKSIDEPAPRSSGQ